MANERKTASASGEVKVQKTHAALTFEAFDTDSSGTIDRIEFANVCHAMEPSMLREEIEAALLTVDTNGDGEVTVDEFEVWYQPASRSQPHSYLMASVRPNATRAVHRGGTWNTARLLTLHMVSTGGLAESSRHGRMRCSWQTPCRRSGCRRRTSPLLPLHPPSPSKRSTGARHVMAAHSPQPALPEVEQRHTHGQERRVGGLMDPSRGRAREGV